MFKKYIEIFITFIKTSTFTFGGGYATLPMLKSEVVLNKKWITEDELTDLFTMSQVLPGLLFVNSAIFVGYRRAGVIGAVLAVVGVLIPAGLSAIILLLLLNRYLNLPVVQNFLKGIIAGITALITISLIDLFKKSIKGIWTLLILIAAFAGFEFLNIKAYALIFSGIFLGLMYSYFSHKKEIVR